jgi:hypothetical protein
MEQNPSWEANVTQLVKSIPTFMEPEGSLPTTGPFPKPDESSMYTPTSFSFKIHFNIILSTTRFSK